MSAVAQPQQRWFTADRLMRTWEADGFRAELYEVGIVDPGSRHSTVAYRLYDTEAPQPDEPVFQGADYGVPSQHTVDGDEAVRGLLGFLALQPGDTDLDYFAGYTTRQLEWCINRGSDLTLASLEAFGED